MIGGTHEINYDERPLSDRKGTRDYRYRLYTFVILSLVQIFVNYDVGLIPVILNDIQDSYKLNSSELGLIGSLPYIGFIFISPFLSHILSNYSNKKSLIFFLSLNVVSLLVFGLAVNKWMFFISKFCIGATQALFFTYYPLWIDSFAPQLHRNLWMSIIQGGIVVGMTIGYIVTSVFTYVGERGWRYSMLTQVTCEAFLTLLFYFIPSNFINVDTRRASGLLFDSCCCPHSDIPDCEGLNYNNMELSYGTSESSSSDECNDRAQNLDLVYSRASALGLGSARRTRIYSSFRQSMIKSKYSRCSKCLNVGTKRESVEIKTLSTFNKFKLLFKYHIFLLSCLTISSLYFEVMGLHYWMTKIGVSHLKLNEKVVHLIFSMEAILGPILGIVSGSYLIDQIIFHYPQYPLIVDFTLIIWASIACGAGVVLIVFQNAMTFAVCIFVILFYGSSLVPTLTLSSIAYLPYYLKPIGASFFITQYNIFGYMLGTLVPGIAVDVFHNYTSALIIIFVSGFIGMGTYIIILLIKWERIKRQKRSL